MVLTAGGPLQPQPQPQEQYISSSEKDAAAAIVPDHAVVFDRALARRVQRKIDWFLIPIMWFGYGLVYYDKVPLTCQSQIHKALLIG